MLIKNYRKSPTADPLISFIQQKRTLVIASDSSTSCAKSGGGWIITDKKEGEILSEFNPDFWDITRCDSLTPPENINDENMSSEKRSLLLTIKLFYEKIGSLSVSKRKWFNHSEEEYRKITVKNLKQWRTKTKRIFKTNKAQTNYRKITEFFQSNNNLPVSRIGNPIQITKHQSDSPTTKTNKNNTYNISKDSNNTNSDSKYDRVS